MRFYTVKELQLNSRIEELTQAGVYLLECIPTGEQYVGSTARSFRQRWKEIRKHSRTKNSKISKLFHSKWEEYGDEGFQFSILKVCDNPKEQEQYWIDTLKPELNINKSADETIPDFDDRWEEHHKQGREEYYQSKQYELDVCKRTTEFKNRLCLDDKEFVITRGKCRLWRLTNKQTGQQYLFKSLTRFCKDNNLNYRRVQQLTRSKLDAGWSLEHLTI